MSVLITNPKPVFKCFWPPLSNMAAQDGAVSEREIWFIDYLKIEYTLQFLIYGYFEHRFQGCYNDFILVNT